MQPPMCPTPSTSAKPVVRALVGNDSAVIAYVGEIQMLKPAKISKAPRKETPIDPPAPAISSAPSRVTVAAIGNQ